MRQKRSTFGEHRPLLTPSVFTKTVLASLSAPLSGDWARQYREQFDQAAREDRLNKLTPRGMENCVGTSPKIGDTIKVRRPEPEPWDLDHELIRFGLRYTPSK
jgi:hypothetical protein